MYLGYQGARLCIFAFNVDYVLDSFPAQFSQRVERTLCSAPPSRLSQWGEEGEEVIIDVFTSSSDKQNYTIEVIPVEQSELK